MAGIKGDAAMAGINSGAAARRLVQTRALLTVVENKKQLLDARSSPIEKPPTLKPPVQSPARQRSRAHFPKCLLQLHMLPSQPTKVAPCHANLQDRRYSRGYASGTVTLVRHTASRSTLPAAAIWSGSAGR